MKRVEQVKRTAMYFRRLARSCQRHCGGTIGQFCEYSEEQVVQQFCEYSVEEQRNFWFLLLLALGVGLRLARVEVRVVVAVVVLVLVGLLLLDVALVLQGLPGEEEHRPGHDALADVVPDLEVSGEQGLRRREGKLGRLADFSGGESLWRLFPPSFPLASFQNHHRRSGNNLPPVLLAEMLFDPTI